MTPSTDPEERLSRIIDLGLDEGRFGRYRDVLRMLTHGEHRIQFYPRIGIDRQIRFLLGFEACGFRWSDRSDQPGESETNRIPVRSRLLCFPI
jgi:hypothetical protein